jgi:hypothetical protein
MPRASEAVPQFKTPAKRIPYGGLYRKINIIFCKISNYGTSSSGRGLQLSYLMNIKILREYKAESGIEYKCKNIYNVKNLSFKKKRYQRNIILYILQERFFLLRKNRVNTVSIAFPGSYLT